MTGQRILNNIRKTIGDFEEGEVVDVTDIGNAMKIRDGRIRWSRCEIAGAMPKLADVFIPTGEKNGCNLKTYVVKHNIYIHN